MKYLVLVGSALMLLPSALAWAEETNGLPFAPDVVSRLSLDGKPRSMAIRQGSDVWLGYDLERAAVFKAWRAPAGESGLIRNGFTTRSTGPSLFEDDTDDGWRLERGNTALPLAVRFLGCSHRNDGVELRWELRPQNGDSAATPLELFERVPLAAANEPERVVRELRVVHLSADESLVPPPAVNTAWRIVEGNEASASTHKTDRPAAVTSATGGLKLRGDRPHRLVLR